MCIKSFHTACWISFLMILSILAGCSRTPVIYPDFPNHSPDQYQYHQENNGLVIGISPITDPQEIRKYFGVNLLEGGVLPVFLSANNQNPKAIFVLQREHITLGLNSNTDKQPEIIDSSDRESMAIAAHLLSALFIPAWASAESEYFELKQNLARKEFRSKTLSPGRQTDGFVYFQIPSNNKESAESPKRTTIQIKVKETKSKQNYQFVFPVVLDTVGN